MEALKIDNTDIFLDDHGNGKGKIIIANPQGFNFSYYWGAMGSSLKEFLCRIDESYFSMKLDPNREGKFDGKRTAKNIRKHIKSEWSNELPWYKFMPLQKELRQKIKDLENCDSKYEFVDLASSIPNDIWLSECTQSDEKEFLEIVKSIFSEPWHFIEFSPSDSTLFLRRLLPKIKSKISN